MERTYGELCYRPVELSIGFFGEGTDPYTQLRGRRTRMLQNILYACYNDALTAEEVSLAIGVALPYLEEELAILTEDGLLVREGKRYSTDIVLFTKAYQRETIEATVSLEKAIAAIVQNAVETKSGHTPENGFPCKSNLSGDGGAYFSLADECAPPAAVCFGSASVPNRPRNSRKQVWHALLRLGMRDRPG